MSNEMPRESNASSLKIFQRLIGAISALEIIEKKCKDKTQIYAEVAEAFDRNCENVVKCEFFATQMHLES